METKEIYKAISNLQVSINTIKKDKKGYNYYYADLASIVEHIKPLFNTYGIGYSQPVSCENNLLNVKTIVFSIKDNSSLESNFTFDLSKLGTSKQSIMQDIGSIITYIRRYTLTSILGIVTDEDPDGIIGIQKPKQQESKVEKTLYDKTLESLETFKDGKRNFKGVDEVLDNKWINTTINTIMQKYPSDPTLEKSINLLRSKLV